MISNRDTFLANLAQAFGRPPLTVPAPAPAPVNNYAKTRSAHLSADELEAMFIEAARGMLAATTRTVRSTAPATVTGLVQGLGGPVLLWAHPTLEETGIAAAVRQGFETAEWDPKNPAQSIEYSRRAETGVVFAEYAIADCGLMVLFSSPEQGRGASLLPRNTGAQEPHPAARGPARADPARQGQSRRIAALVREPHRRALLDSRHRAHQGRGRTRSDQGRIRRHRRPIRKNRLLWETA